MNPFDTMPKSDFEVISPDGEVRSSGEGTFQGNRIFVPDVRVQVITGDEIRRRLPSGVDDVFEVVDPRFHDQVRNLPAHLEIHVRRKGAFPHHQGGHFNISVTGANARVNVGSTDNSTNVVAHHAVFNELVGAIRQGVPEPAQEALVASVREMESSQGKPGFIPAYQRFMSSAADHMTVIAPFLPALSALL